MEETVYRVVKIEGDYATLISEKSGEELFIAMALLPLCSDIGTRLLYFDFSFSVI